MKKLLHNWLDKRRNISKAFWLCLILPKLIYKKEIFYLQDTYKNRSTFKTTTSSELLVVSRWSRVVYDKSTGGEESDETWLLKIHFVRKNSEFCFIFLPSLETTMLRKNIKLFPPFFVSALKRILWFKKLWGILGKENSVSSDLR